MAAANSKGRILAGSLGKRLVSQIWASAAWDRAAQLAAPAASARLGKRGVQTSSYDKNLDEHVRPTVVPDNVIDLTSDKYWGPDPETGIFGPGADEETTGGNGKSAGGSGARISSTLEQTAWFRPLEDVDKPRHY